MKIKDLTLEPLLLWTTAVSARVTADAATAAVVARSSDSNSSSFPGLAIGNQSVQGHQAKHAETVMDNIEKVCGAVAEMSYPARKAAGMLLRESN